MAIPLIAGALVASISSFFIWIIKRVIALFGIGFITFLGVQPFITFAANQIRSYLNLNPPSWFPIVQWLGLMQLDVCVSILISAVSIKLLLSGLNKSGSFSKLRINGGD